MKCSPLCFLLLMTPALAQRLQPTDLVYLGAIQLPGPSGGSNWEYSGDGATYYPQGDPSGPNDGFPGSILAIGHDQHQQVSEISIPPPILSQAPNQLNMATTLQPFADVTAGMFGSLEIARADLEYLPALASQRSGKIHFCWGQHFQFDRVPSHGWCELDLSAPHPQGPWYLGSWTNYVTNDYLFEIPAEWAEQYVGGKRLATGRFRDGGWGGHGPALFAYAPWPTDTPPPAQSEIALVTPLLTYGQQQPGSPELMNADSTSMIYYQDPDEWSGGAWLTQGGRSAVIFVGSKAMGHCWYGFANGVVWPEEGPWPPVPDPPFDQRGWWADSIQAQILFYDPKDLAEVAQGKKLPWHPQPYAVKNVNPFLFKPGYDYGRGKMRNLGACCYDRSHGFLYIFERLAIEEKSVIHAFKIQSTTLVGEINRSAVDFLFSRCYPNPFNPQTIIHFSLTSAAHTTVTVFDIAGQRVKTVWQGPLSPGRQRICWRGVDESDRNVASGIYFYRIETAREIGQGKVVLVR